MTSAPGPVPTTPVPATVHGAPNPNAADGSVADGLLAEDTAHWAFGTDFDDPLAGVDTTVPTGVDASVVARYALLLADDALIASQRLAEWCSRAPDLEDDIALANLALDLLGQARLLLVRAAAADPGLVPGLPAGSPVPPEDALAYFRGPADFANLWLAEVENGDFAHTVIRLLLLSAVRLAVFTRLAASRDPVLAAIAAKGAKELAYHRDYAGRWFVTLARGTAESRRRLLDGLDQLWPLYGEAFAWSPVEVAAAEAGIGVDPTTVLAEVSHVLQTVFSAAGVDRSAQPQESPADRGRSGRHTPALGALLAEMQSVARAHPSGRW